MLQAHKDGFREQISVESVDIEEQEWQSGTRVTPDLVI
jgi:hypothetical protein